MGYELVRFVGAIENEFCCNICGMVLENPVQSKCEHVFCKECINERLKYDTTCPADSCSLALGDFKPTPTYFCSLLDKLEMKCIYEAKGCQSIIPMEHQRDHLINCIYNPNSEVICDKGCNFKMARCEYEGNNCFIHLAKEIKRQADKIGKLSDTVSLQREEILHLYGELRIRGKVAPIVNVVDPQHGQAEKNEKLSDTVSQQRVKILHLPSSPVIRSEITPTVNLVNLPKWRVFEYMEKSGNHSCILEHSPHHGDIGYAQLYNSLEPSNSRFKVLIMEVHTYLRKDCIAIGLTNKDHFANDFNGPTYGSIHYRSSGVLNSFQKSETFQAWKVGDVIECGIKFPKNFVNDRSNNVRVYFSLNEQLISEEVLQMPLEGFFPTIFMWTSGGKVKYLSN